MEKGRYYRNRFVAISEVILQVIQLDLMIESYHKNHVRLTTIISLYFTMNCSRNGLKNTKKITEEIELGVHLPTFFVSVGKFKPRKLTCTVYRLITNSPGKSK